MIAGILRGRRSRGNAMLEFTFVGIPLMFVLISIFELSRVTWQYNTAANAVREAVRFAAVHGNDCGGLPNSCTKTIQQVAERIQFHGPGLVPNDITSLEFIWGEADETPDFTCADLEHALQINGQTCSDASEFWPGPPPGDPPRAGGFFTQPITIRMNYRFRSAIGLFWPGSGPVEFGSFDLPVSSTEMVHY